MSQGYSPWAHVRALDGVLVAYDALEHADAYWDPDHRVILLDERLGQAARRSRLAHELAHIDRGDECCHHGPDAARLGRRQEGGADWLAACRLIPLDELADALVWCLGTAELAEHFHVDQRTVAARLRGLSTADKDYMSGAWRRRTEQPDGDDDVQGVSQAGLQRGVVVSRVWRRGASSRQPGERHVDRGRRCGGGQAVPSLGARMRGPGGGGHLVDRGRRPLQLGYGGGA